MKTTHILAAALLALGCAGSAWADHPRYWYRPHASIEFVFGPPFYPYPHPLFWPPVVVSQPIVVQPAPVYIEQSPPPQTLEPGYWYWCAEAQAYYPDVKNCPGPWQKIPPRPAQ